MNLSEAYAEYEARCSEQGGSPFGMSYWTKAASCARSLLLERSQPKARDYFDEGVFNVASGKLDALRVGTAYHLLHELRPEMTTPERVVDAEFAEGLRLYRAWIARFDSVHMKYGFEEYIVEAPLPFDSPNGWQAIQKLYKLPSNVQVTGQMDGVGFIPDAALSKVYDNTGLILPRAGYYILDFKTARSASAGELYTLSIQACAYLTMYNACLPDSPVAGMIFDQVTKTKEPKFAHHLALASDMDPRRVENLVRIGVASLAANEGRGLCNETGCGNHMKVCYWKKTGACPGF